ncbi:MAG: helix-turn-helix domain-containing protein [Candidatus Eremiobacteraeota bacterium]|nr:helix-turn-helix domain-containing protein [Candidatus Eremiobacteraeota bacterium]
MRRKRDRDMQAAEIDLRGLPGWDRPGLLGEALDQLPYGASLTFITENEPRGLSQRIIQERTERYVIETRRVARGMWRVSLTRRHPEEEQPNPLVTQLEACAAFAALDSKALRELAEAGVEESGRRGDTLVAENEQWPFIGMVLDGIVARSKGAESERERILYEIFPHELFGVAEYFDRGHANAHIAVFSKSARIVKLPWKLVDEVASRHPELTLALGVVIAQRLRLMNDTINEQGSLPILARIARVLLPYAMPERGLVPAAPSLSSITQSQIAAAAGTVKEVAARAIAELEAQQALRRERGHIRYLDRQQLVELIRELS